MEIPQKIQDEITQFQKLQQQAQAVTAQKQNLEIQIQENENAIAQLKKTDADATVYKTAGSLLIEVKLDEISTEVEEKIETLKLTEKRFSSQEKKLLEKLQEKQSYIQESMTAAGIQ
ncbi:MAG: prefoldin subunit beta [Methanobrevibacter sp.]|jgi:prefoldin beta subunit|nr:prefoldin subunit beta [Methanobrevibacter sp.]